ncbi:MAG: riboflavin biosynthesis protein RibF [Desulfobacterales bacterium]|nr:MAG: riboflavin biosynthesis protein RibF [Desulfobacterales bacterium]
MKIYWNLEEIPESFSYACVTIGNFDGVHLGHQLLFNEVRRRARVHGGTAVAITFDPHPLEVLRPDGVKLLSSCEEKVALVEQAGLDVLVIVPFTRDFAAITAEHFVAQLLDRTGMKELVVGYDYAFGKGRTGDITFLRDQGIKQGFTVTVLDAYYQEGTLVSSTRVRALLAEGEVAAARKLLGRNYQITGEVQRGMQRGSRLGFPTANLHFSPREVVPRHGVYVVRVHHGKQSYGGVLNIGCNPTFGAQEALAEVHIFDFDEDIYGKSLKIDLIRFLRKEKKYPDVKALVAQIERDVVAAKTILADYDIIE